MPPDESNSFRFGDHEVEPGEKRQVKYPVGTTCNGDPIEMPVTVVNGESDGPRVFLTAAVHGDELNGVKVLQETADRSDPADLHGTLVCLHVLNVPALNVHQRYVPVYDRDLNRSFPGNAHGTTAARMANTIYEEFVGRCDLGVDFHTSTRNRTTMYHVRADTSEPAVERLARAFGASLILDGKGSAGTLRRAAVADGTPTITVEMGKAHRFQPALVARALRGVESVLAEYGVLPDRPVVWPGWRRVVQPEHGRAWIRADRGGLVEMQWGPYPLVRADEPICTISDHFKDEMETVRAPFDGLVVGVLENPLAQPGHPLCHFVQVDETLRDIIEEWIEHGSFDVYRPGGFQSPMDGEPAEA